MITSDVCDRCWGSGDEANPWPSWRERQGLQTEIERLKQWVADLQDGGYVNCVYCGHRYGPKGETPVAMAAVLKCHVEQCPEHPLSEFRAVIGDLIQPCVCDNPKGGNAYHRAMHRAMVLIGYNPKLPGGGL